MTREQNDSLRRFCDPPNVLGDRHHTLCGQRTQKTPSATRLRAPIAPRLLCVAHRHTQTGPRLPHPATFMQPHTFRCANRPLPARSAASLMAASVPPPAAAARRAQARPNGASPSRCQCPWPLGTHTTQALAPRREGRLRASEGRGEWKACGARSACARDSGLRARGYPDAKKMLLPRGAQDGERHPICCRRPAQHDRTGVKAPRRR